MAVDNVRRMIRRDWNHPAIVLWGVRINESRDNHDFYTRTNAIAHELDPSRQTGGIRYFQGSEFLEDVFTMNDFGFPLKAPNHPCYLNTEFVGHTYVTKTYDNGERLAEHIRRMRGCIINSASNAQYAGGIGWCAFDYNTHDNFGSGDRICYHGVSTSSACPSRRRRFTGRSATRRRRLCWNRHFTGRRAMTLTRFTVAMVCSNCDHLKLFVKNDGEWKQFAEAIRIASSSST